MDNKEYVIKGTVEGMIRILQKDFGMTVDEAKFFVYVMIERNGGEVVNAANKDELDAWYLTSEVDKYKGQILNTHLVINFTTLKEELCHLAYDFLVEYFFLRGINLVLIGADLVYFVIASIKKVKDTDYCVYARIIELCIGNRGGFFDVKDIVTANKDGKCDYQEENWKCVYHGKNDDCTCNEQKVMLAFTNLAKQNIIKPVGDRWMLVK